MTRDHLKAVGAGSEFPPASSETLRWSSDFLVGHADIDHQHEHLIYLTNGLMRHSPEDAPVLAGVMRQVYYYTRYHFQSEENIMMLLAYPAANEHRYDHLRVIETLEHVDMALLGSKEGLDTLVAVVSEWFHEHVQHYDFALADYLRRMS